jgi:hypothetical protein
MMNKKLALLALTAAIVSSASLAREQNSGAFTVGEWHFAGYGSTVSLDGKSTALEGVEDSAYSIGATADYIQNSWVTSIGGEILIYDDNAEFKQRVEGTGLFNDGDVSTTSSDANAFLLYVASGYQWRFNEEQGVALTLQGGLAALIASERSIDSCSNCFSEDIDLDAGPFVKASLTNSTDSVSFGVYVQQYLSGDLSNAFGISIGTKF